MFLHIGVEDIRDHEFSELGLFVFGEEVQKIGVAIFEYRKSSGDMKVLKGLK